MLEAETDTTVTLRRFAEFTTIKLGTLHAGEQAVLHVPEDSEPTPWVAAFDAGPVAVCRRG